MRERIESKHVTKEIKSQVPVIPVEIVKERGCTFCPYYLGNYEKQPRCMMKTCAWDDENERFHPVLRGLIPFYKEKMEKAEENVSALMQDVLERFETWAEQDHKEITLSGKDDISLNCDALWMSEAIGNIVKNALEHTQPGGHISVQWTQSPLLTQIVITDDGKGIHQEDLYNIFKRFYRSRFSSDVHGIGLGLPLAKSIVEAHGGTISVTSTLNVGTTFTLNFFSLTNE